MPKQLTATAFDHDRTLVLALELSSKGWEVSARAGGRVTDNGCDIHSVQKRKCHHSQTV